MPIIGECAVIISRFLNKIERETVYITGITEEEEKKLDKGFLKIVRDNITFTINRENIIAYGDIDFHEGSDDFNQLEQMKWFDHLVLRGIDIPSNYDYDEHCCYTVNNRVLHYDSTNPADVTQYKHGCIGKPERTLIFKRKTTSYGKGT